MLGLATGFAVVVLTTGCARQPAQTVQTVRPADCTGVPALVVHNDTQGTIELVSYGTSGMPHSIAIILAGAQSEPLPRSGPRDMQVRNYPSGERSNGSGVRYESVCVTSGTS